MKRLFIIFAFLLWLPLAYADQAKHDAAHEALEAGDYATALSILIPLAEFGSATAQFNLGVLYYTGNGVVKDRKEAFQWYIKAAKGGLPHAQFNVSAMYYQGEGVAKSLKKAYLWGLIAEASGNKNVSSFLNAAEKKLSFEDKTEMLELATICIESDYKNCVE